MYNIYSPPRSTKEGDREAEESLPRAKHEEEYGVQRRAGAAAGAAAGGGGIMIVVLKDGALQFLRFITWCVSIFLI